MLVDLAAAAGKAGLELYPDKTKILAKACGGRRGRLEEVELLFGSVKVMPLTESTLYVGRKLAFGHSEDTEINHRISKGRANFMTYKEQLCNKYCAEAPCAFVGRRCDTNCSLWKQFMDYDCRAGQTTQGYGEEDDQTNAGYTMASARGGKKSRRDQALDPMKMQIRTSMTT